MNIKDFKSLEIKKKLNADSVSYRWHNKNKIGGSFGINIIGVNGRDYQISGHYNNKGVVRELRFRPLSRYGISMDVDTVEEMVEFICKITGNGGSPCMLHSGVN